MIELDIGHECYMAKKIIAFFINPLSLFPDLQRKICRLSGQTASKSFRSGYAVKKKWRYYVQLVVSGGRSD
jgi:hypothetical protein